MVPEAVMKVMLLATPSESGRRIRTSDNAIVLLEASRVEATSNTDASLDRTCHKT